jgi:hypothetical protein
MYSGVPQNAIEEKKNEHDHAAEESRLKRTVCFFGFGHV